MRRAGKRSSHPAILIVGKGTVGTGRLMVCSPTFYGMGFGCQGLLSTDASVIFNFLFHLADKGRQAEGENEQDQRQGPELL